MRCDKCRKKFTNNWVPGVFSPEYEIKETTGIGEHSQVNLCYECCQLFKEWLSEEPQEDEGFGQ
jgi:hypothetical protein